MSKLYSRIVLAAAVLATGCPLSGVPLVPIVVEPESQQPLSQWVEQTLRENLDERWLSTETHGAWQIMHGILAYGHDFMVRTPAGEQAALAYVLRGGTIRGFEPQRGDRLGPNERLGIRLDIDPSSKVGQGHSDQWLAVLLQCGLDADTEIRADEHTFTMLDWVNQAEYDVPRNLQLEFSWTLIALTAMHPTNHTWLARDGQRYSTEFLLQVEVEQDLVGSVCGGTHRLIGIAMALEKRRREGRPITGAWQAASELIETQIATAKANQNPDGSYSSAYLHRPGWTRDLGETLGTTGHVLEFLAIAASDETLRQPWVERSVRKVCDVLQRCRDVDLECGALYHALHGLALYQQRTQSTTNTSPPMKTQ